jgi:hypothetical protein
MAAKSWITLKTRSTTSAANGCVMFCPGMSHESPGREGWIGGMIYDALIAKVADAARVDRLITLNVMHFQRVWPAGAVQIAAPQAVPPPR